MREDEIYGVITRGVGGKYTVLGLGGNAGETFTCNARGVFRHDEVTPTVGDVVSIIPKDDEVYMIDKIAPRRSLLMRPPVANLDMLFVIVPTCRPAPDTLTVDKLLSIAEHDDINASVVITKCELDRAAAAKMQDIYTRAGYSVFPVSSDMGEGIEALRGFIASIAKSNDEEKIYCITSFAGASGAGKSTLLNALYPSLSLTTGELSRKTARGRQTTRQAELFPVGGGVLIADTPGFSLIDFERFDFFSLEALPYTFREFEPCFGKCRYTKCTHLTEEGCAVIADVESGRIPRERHENYKALYAVLKSKNPWSKKAH
ncbi:MAG: ribosome small subunit-dependent GTPase A [Firmicutes bacterium]|nr:ribosome small subunit-dependent GTPase A [Bacillota bacterium]